MAGFTLPITLPLTWTAPRASQFWVGQDRDLKVKVFISRPDGVTWTDISDYVTYIHRKRGDVSSVGTGQTGADVMSQTCTVRIANARRFDAAWDENTAADELYIVGDEADVVGDSHDSAALFIDKLFGVSHKDIALGDSFHPLDRNSPWNQFDVNGDGVLEYAPLLFPRREIVIDVAAVPVNTTPGPADWVRIFHGYLGDGIEADAASSEIVIECRDVMKLLMDTFIEVKRTYGSEAGTPAEVVMQQIIDDNMTNGPRIYCPISPGLMIKPYECGYKSVADALVEIANQCGWWIGSRWIPDYNDFRLTFMAPPRGKDASCADWSFDWTRDILMQTLKLSDREIRNVVCLTFRNEATGMRETVTVFDQPSIDAFGRRAMGIEEADTSLINTRAEALAMAEAALHDQKDLPATTEIELPFLPTLDIFDGILINNPLLSSTQDFYAVNTAEDVLEVRGDKLTARTRVVAAGRVTGGLWKWRRMETRPGSPAHWRTEIMEKYSWLDDFILTPYDPKLWTVTLGTGCSLGAADDAFHALRIRAQSNPLSPPARPTLRTQSTGGALSNGTYYVAVTACNANGETAASDIATITLSAGTATQTIDVIWPPVEGATSYRVYIGTYSALWSLFHQATVSSTAYSQLIPLATSGDYAPSTNNTGRAVAELRGVIAASRSMGVTKHIIRFRAKFTSPGSGHGAVIGWIAPYWIEDVIGGVSSAGTFFAQLGRGITSVTGIAIPYGEYANYRIEITEGLATLYINDALAASLTMYLPPFESRIIARVQLLNAGDDGSTYSLDVDSLEYKIQI